MLHYYSGKGYTTKCYAIIQGKAIILNVTLLFRERQENQEDKKEEERQKDQKEK